MNMIEPIKTDMVTSGATFIVGQVNFRCIDIIGTETPLFECNVCTSVVTDPMRHLRENDCDHRVVRNGPSSDRLGDSWRS